MNKKLLDILLWIVAAISCMQVFRVLAVTNTHEITSNSLCKVFHHKNTVVESNKSVATYGTVSIYFSGKEPALEPRILSKKMIADTKQEWLFFFPGATIADKVCRSMIDRINKESFNQYTIHIYETTNPQKGIIAQFVFNPGNLAVEYTPFVAITGQRGLEFRFINKVALHVAKERINEKRTTRIARAQPIVVIDPGHGGNDFGACGVNGIREKDICLCVASVTQELLALRGYQTYLTRSKDVDVPLDMRTSYANKLDADLFVSIHANAEVKKKGKGVETFYLDGLGYHSTSKRDLTGMEELVLTSIDTLKQDCSMKVANLVQNEIVTKTKSVDRSVKTAVSQVLVGTQMPSILIEIGFVTNESEGLLLAKSEYQRAIAQAIDSAIAQYFSV